MKLITQPVTPAKLDSEKAPVIQTGAFSILERTPHLFDKITSTAQYMITTERYIVEEKILQFFQYVSTFPCIHCYV